MFVSVECFYVFDHLFLSRWQRHSFASLVHDTFPYNCLRVFVCVCFGAYARFFLFFSPFGIEPNETVIIVYGKQRFMTQSLNPFDTYYSVEQGS